MTEIFGDPVADAPGCGLHGLASCVMSTQKFKNLVELLETSVEQFAGRELFGTKVAPAVRTAIAAAKA